jgi:hypothetical protein
LNGQITLGILAQSQMQVAIQDEDFRPVTIDIETDVDITWEPNEITVDGITEAAFSLVVTNTGNALSTFALTVVGDSGLAFELPIKSLLLPPGSTAKILVAVTAPGGGSYELRATATSGPAQDSATAMLNVEGIDPPVDGLIIYLPVVVK